MIFRNIKQLGIHNTTNFFLTKAPSIHINTIQLLIESDCRLKKSSSQATSRNILEKSIYVPSITEKSSHMWLSDITENLAKQQNMLNN